MKIKPQIYAEALLESKAEPRVLAEGFWHTLQKNKQYKDLPKILDALDEVYAKKNGLTLACVYSSEKLDESELSAIRNQLSASGKRQAESGKLLIKNIIKPNLTGVIVKIDDKVIDLTVEGKIERLKKVISGD